MTGPARRRRWWFARRGLVDGGDAPEPQANVVRVDVGNVPFLANLAVLRLRDAGVKVSDVIGVGSGEAAHFPTQGLWIFIRAEDADQVRPILGPLAG